MAKKVSSEEILRPIWTEHDDSHEKDGGKKKKNSRESVRDNDIYYDYHYVW